ncbi:MAG: hypothetical protein C0465_25885 [Ralstonia sp.]|uniref:glycine zipper 2TM domain-containing protein n=1 Tax=Ralstonia sp. TaxID=54061 RepID=UPI000D2638E8|nr:glycine zipper 2TM domain-containing protein [Ralstonia sp.]MBA4234007.1 hypothetical protein [Ralstonia sp.]PPD32346.1 MAG: hypothetical protein CTY21_11525 [Methylomonas sp.]
MKRILPVFALLGLLLVTGCAGMPGTNTGALVGGVAGAALSRDNPIAGAVIGGVGGALLGNLIDNSGRDGFRNDGYRGNHGYHRNHGYSDRAYYERQRAFEQQRAYEEQMRWRHLQQQRQWEQPRYHGGRGCWLC